MTDQEVKLPPIPKYITELIDGYLADDSGNVSETKLRNVQKVMLAFARAAVLAERERIVALVESLGLESFASPSYQNQTLANRIHIVAAIRKGAPLTMEEYVTALNATS